MPRKDTPAKPKSRRGYGSIYQLSDGTWAGARSIYQPDGTRKRVYRRGASREIVSDRLDALPNTVPSPIAESLAAKPGRYHSGQNIPVLAKAERGGPLGPVDFLEARIVLLELKLAAHIAACGRQPIPQSQRKRLIKRDGLACRYCGVAVELGKLHIDHLIPVIAGGTNVDENLVVACRPCNHRKTDYSLEQVGMTLLPVPESPTLPQTALWSGRRKPEHAT